MRSDKQHTNLLPRQRLQAVAEILARGFLRLRALDLVPTGKQAGDENSEAKPLDECQKTSVTVDRAVGHKARA